MSKKVTVLKKLVKNNKSNLSLIFILLFSIEKLEKRLAMKKRVTLFIMNFKARLCTIQMQMGRNSQKLKF